MNTENAKVIIVRGAKNKGKTTVVYNFIKYLLSTGGEIIQPGNISFDDILSKNEVRDYCLIIRYQEKNVLIMSQGDGIRYIKSQFMRFIDIEINIDIIVGCCWSRGKTVEWWKSKFGGRICFIYSYLMEKDKISEHINERLEQLKLEFNRYL